MVSIFQHHLNFAAYYSNRIPIEICLDAFIITGSYSRTNATLTTAERIDSTMEDCGLSIFVTTLTTSTAFCLSLTSKIPAIREFSIYAIISVWVDFIYQLTFFIAMIKLNDERITKRRFDVFPCCSRENNDDSQVLAEGDMLNQRMMKSYGKKIVALSKTSKTIIVIGENSIDKI